MTEKELMRIKRDLKARAKRKHLGKKRTGAYVYGTLRKIRGNPSMLIDRLRKHPWVAGFMKKTLKVSFDNKVHVFKKGTTAYVSRLGDDGYVRLHHIRAGSPIRADLSNYVPLYIDDLHGYFVPNHENFDIYANPAKCDAITSTDWEEKENTLVFEKNMKPVCMGQKVRSRGTYVGTGGRAPHKPSSSGRVYVKEVGKSGWGREFFPNVFNMKWVPSYNLFPVDKVSGKSRLQINGGRKKTWKIGEYAIGGIIEAKVSQDGRAVAIRNAEYKDNSTISTRLFRWPLDKFRMEQYLNELTTSYYADKIIQWLMAGSWELRSNSARISDVALLKAYKLLNRYRRLRELLNRYDVLELMPSVSAMRNDPATFSILSKIVRFTDSPYHARKLGVENLQKEVDAYVDETEMFLEENARSDARGMPSVSVSRG